MRVVYVSSLPKGGPVTHLRTLAPAVARAGADVHVVCLDENVAVSFRALGIDTSVAPLRSKTDVAGAWRTRSLLKRADVVHTQDRRAGLLVRPLARLVGAEAVHTQHGLPPEIGTTLGSAARPPRSRMAFGYVRAEVLLSRLGAVVVPSQALARYLIDRGMPAARVHVIPHGIDVPAVSHRADAVREGPVVVGATSNLEHEKGVDVLIEACALASRSIRLELLGDGARRAELERLALERGVDTGFAGHVADVRTRLATFDIFALPSRAENFPVGALEAMAAGLPVVATRVGGVPELVVDGETGLLVEPEDAAALAGALDALTGDDSTRGRLGEAGARRARELFDADRMATRMLALYESLA